MAASVGGSPAEAGECLWLTTGTRTLAAEVWEVCFQALFMLIHHLYFVVLSNFKYLYNYPNVQV